MQGLNKFHKAQMSCVSFLKEGCPLLNAGGKLVFFLIVWGFLS